MKNTLLAAVLTLLPLSTLAGPAIGDTSIYDLETGVQGTPLKGEYIVTVTSIDVPIDSITRTIQVKLVGSLSKQTLKTKLSDFQNAAATRAERIQNCERHGGVPEVVTTPAGPFKTCKMPVSTQDITGFQWIADVPEGYVKYVSINRGETTTQVLREFRAGR